MARKLFFVVTILLALIETMHSQSYYFRHYQVEHGLSNNAVICSLQDKKGFIWFGTKDGLNRFDGYAFKIFRNNADDSSSIGSNFIHSLYEDHNGILWVGTEKGLYKYDAATESFSLLKATANGQIRDIQMDGKGNLWFISGFTLCTYSEAKKVFTYYDVNKYFEATSICTDFKGTLWISTSSGLLEHYDAAHNSFTSYNAFSHSAPVVSKWIEKIYGSANGTILIGTSNQGAKSFDIASNNYKDILTYNSDKTALFVRNFVQTSANEFWIGTETGIFIYNTQNNRIVNLRKSYNDPYSISDNAVYTFCKDKEGGIWTGTYFGGANYYPKQYTPFQKYFPKVGENSLSGNVVREIRQDHYGNLWMGTEDAGLNKLDRKTGRFIHFTPTGAKNSISYSNIHGLLVNGNELWIGTFEHGLDVMDIQSEKVIRHYEMGSGAASLKSNFIYTLYRTTAGEILIATTRGAYSYNARQNNFTPLPGMPINNWYTSLLKDDEGIIWAGTYGNGVNYYNTITKTCGHFGYEAVNKNSLASDRVNSIFKDSNKNLWFATEGGLCKWNKSSNSFTRYTTKNGFPSNFFLSMLEDGRKNLWISTSKGLVCFNPATEYIKTYTRSNGILNDQFNFNSAFKDTSGRMYFGSTKGLVSFQPNEFIQNTFTPPVYITGLQVFNKDLTIADNGSPLKKSITYTPKITLNHNQSTISIDFAALSYTAPEMLEYAYKMEGLDQSWTFLKRNRKAYFTELLPGTYVFKVKASNSSGVWNGAETKLVIQILPPWWRSTPAYIGYVVLVLLLVYYIIRSDRKRMEEKNRRKIELLETAKEKEILQAKIEFFTNVAHEIRTPLTLIKGPLEKVMKKASGISELSNSLNIMERNTNRLVALTNQLLDFRQTEIKGFSLNFVSANIAELLEETYNNFKSLAEEKNLDYTIELPLTSVYAFVDVEALNKILSNLFSNAVKYAATKVQVSLLSLSAHNNTFTIEIKNDGYLISYEMKDKIFEPFYRLKHTEKQKGTGIGLALSLSLVQLHKGSLELKQPQGDMNIFSLILPVHQEHEFNLHPQSMETTLTTEVNSEP